MLAVRCCKQNARLSRAQASAVRFARRFNLAELALRKHDERFQCENKLGDEHGPERSAFPCRLLLPGCLHVGS